MAKKKIDPEFWKRAEEAKRNLQGSLERAQARIAAREAAEARRRARLRRLTFGRFGREPDERQAA